MPVELLPCPFCGGEAQYEALYPTSRVWCRNCWAELKHQDQEKLIKQWNQRAEKTDKVKTSGNKQSAAAAQIALVLSDLSAINDGQLYDKIHTKLVAVIGQLRAL